MNENKIVLDTDFIVSLAVKTDTTSMQAQQLYHQILKKEFIILNLVKYETATVLSKKISHIDAIQTLKNIDWDNFKIFKVDEFENEIWHEYESYTKKGISFTDCANLVLARKLNCKIASFDQFYPKEFLLS